MRDQAASITLKQWQYLAFIHSYIKLNGRSPAEAEFQRYFRATPPTVHDMIKRLTAKGLIERRPGVPRSIVLRVEEKQIPPLD